jgi:WD40 repeat protein
MFKKPSLGRVAIAFVALVAFTILFHARPYMNHRIESISILLGWPSVLIAEIVALQPLARRWKESRIAFWLVLFASVAIVGSAVWVETILSLGPIISPSIIFLTVSLLATSFAVRQGLQVFAMWVALGLSLLSTLTICLYSSSIVDLGALFGIEDLVISYVPSLTIPRLLGYISSITLSTASAITILRRFTTRPELSTCGRWMIGAVLVAIIAFIVYQARWLLYNQLYPFDKVAGPVSWVSEIVWHMVIMTIVLALTLHMHRSLSAAWQAIIIGNIFGALIVLVLIYPVYTWILPEFVADLEFTNPAHGVTAAVCKWLGVLLAVAAGPVAVAWSCPPGWRGRLAMGAAVGALVGAFLFGGLGGPVSGLIAESPLYGVAQSRVGYGENEWVLKFAIAINNTAPATYLAFWLLISCAGLLGGLTGLAMPFQARWATKKAVLSQPATWLPFMIFGTFILSVSILTNASILNLFGRALQNVFDQYGFMPKWNPDWTLLVAAGQPWSVLIIVQVFGLRWLYRQSKHHTCPRRVALVAFTTSLVLFLLAFILLWIASSNPLIYIAALITAAFGFEMLVASGQLWELVGTDDTSGVQSIGNSTRSAWAASAVGGGLLATILNHQLMATALSLILIGIVLIVDLASTTNPPPGLEWLERNLSVVFVPHMASFVVSIIACGVLGALVGAALAGLRGRWILRVWLCLQPIVRRVQSGVSVIWGRRLSQILTALGGAALALTIGITIPSTTLLILISALFTFFVLGRRSREWMRGGILALIFALSTIGFIGAELIFSGASAGISLWERLVYFLLVGPAVGMVFRTLTDYVPPHMQVKARLFAFVGIAILLGSIGYGTGQFDWDSLFLEGNISQYDGRSWKPLTSQNAVMNGQMNYQFFEDSQGHLLVGSGNGMLFQRSEGEWKEYGFPGGWWDIFRDQERWEKIKQLSERMLITKDEMGHLWVALGSDLVQLDPRVGSSRLSRLSAGDPSTQEVESYYDCPNGIAQLWRVNGELVSTLAGHSDQVTDAAFSPDGTRILTASEDGSVRVWDASGNFVDVFAGRLGQIESVSFSPDGTQVATTSPLDESVRLWNWDGTFIGWYEKGVEEVAWLQTDADGGIIHSEDYEVSVEGADGDFTVPSPGGTWVVARTDESTILVARADTYEVVATLHAYAGWINAVAFSLDDQYIVTAECMNGAYTTLTFDSFVKDIVRDNADNLWLATEGDGVVWVETGRQPGDARWEIFISEKSDQVLEDEAKAENRENSFTRKVDLASDVVYAVEVDRHGAIWFGTDAGLSRYDGVVWETIDLPVSVASKEETGEEKESEVSVMAILKDSKGRIWIGTDGGVYAWDGQIWTPYWDVNETVEILFEDNQGGLWAGTPMGAYFFDGQKWTNPVADIHVTAFEREPKPSAAVWIGGQQGLIRYDREAGELNSFNSSNSSLAADCIQDLHIDSEGKLWVSTFAVTRESTQHLFRWGSIALTVLLFGCLFIYTHRNYSRAPQTRACQLGRQILGEPDSLYPTVYTLLADAADAPLVLKQVGGHLSRAGDLSGSEAVTALAALSSESDARKALDQSTAALSEDIARAWAGSLHQLHDLLASALNAQRLSDIADLELTVNPGQDPGSISLRTRRGSVETPPPFLPKGTTEAWRGLERVSLTLRKYQRVDTAADRLSYLAQALGAIGEAQTTITSVGPPEGPAMVAVAKCWRTTITDEIEFISGRAELRLELHTRQVRRANQITLALHVQNTGRAAAENVTITLQPSKSFSPDSETEVSLERLSSGRSAPVEFAIVPIDAESIRVTCYATWSDRVAEDNRIEFADQVRLYETSEEFQRIPNPYIVGHPVKSTEMFQGREDVFQFIADNLSGPVQDRTLVLHGQRRTGKTSILYQLLQGRLGEGFIPVLVDMQELALLVSNTGDFLGELAYQLARTARKAGVEIKEPAPDVFAASPIRAFNRFLDALEDQLGDQRVVVMFDEFELIESKIAQGKLDADLLDYFRSLMQHRSRLIFIFTGTHRLEEMSQDYWSIFFNIALYRRVSFLSLDEAARLIREPVAGALDIDELAVEKIINLTNGHPYFIQLICWALVNHCNAQERSYATINDINQVLQEILTTGEAHFAYIWQQASGAERLALAGLAHTLRPGKMWARPAEILETLAAGGDRQTRRADLVSTLDQLVTQEVLEVSGDGVLRYRFQIEVLRLWIEATKSVAALVERAGGA